MQDPADHTIPAMADQATGGEPGQEAEMPQQKSAPGILASGLWVILVIIAIDCIGMLQSLVLPAIQAAREAPRRAQCQSNMKQLGFAANIFHEENVLFPSYYDPAHCEHPPCSWRVQLLPNIGKGQVYEQYDRTQPWNSTTNRALERDSDSLYKCPSNSSSVGRGNTDSDYATIIGPHCAFRERDSATIADITDGTSNTIMFVETADNGIHWMEPRDLKFEDARMAEYDSTDNCICSPHPGIVNITLCDGSARSISHDIDPKLLKALMTIDGGESVEGFYDQSKP